MTLASCKKAAVLATLHLDSIRSHSHFGELRDAATSAVQTIETNPIQKLEAAASLVLLSLVTVAVLASSAGLARVFLTS